MTERDIFIVALQKEDPAHRQVYLDEACAGEPELRKQVEELLRLYERAGSFLQKPAVSAVTEAKRQSSEMFEAVGAMIGPYKLLEKIGEGGMGSVWMAQQTDPVKRVVALKLIKAGMDSKQVIARFEAERQALALMDHANIARVLDAGSTSSGRHYFVMDLVKGIPITRYCDEHHLTPQQRLELFIPVCQAIQHAHQKGIIHRDVKPSNVLVALYDGKPVPKVIDFGVAKAAGQPLTEKTLVTGFGAIVGTLEYMAPEQAEINQLDIDTRSDIYSLGVLLYELLAGSPPFSQKELEKVGLLEMLRVIREQEPAKPSTKLSTAVGLATLAANRGTEPAKLTNLMRGELDWIVMKALEKDRNRRYETANGVAADLQRYLSGEAVQAVPPSVSYRMQKFARRNKGSLAATALVLLFLVLLASGIGWAVRDKSAREAEAARHQAQREAKVAGQVESIFAEVDRLESEQKWSEALSAVRRADAAVSSGEANPETAGRVLQRLKDLEFIDRLDQIRMERAISAEGTFNNSGTVRKYARAFRDYGVDVEETPIGKSIELLKSRPILASPLASALEDWAMTLRDISTDAVGWQRLVNVARAIDPDPLREMLRSTLGRPASEVKSELTRLANTIDIRTQPPGTLGTFAHALRQANLSSSALRILREAQFIHPDDFWLTFAYGSQLGKQKDHRGSIRFFTATVSIRPNSAGAHHNLGCALMDQRMLDEAVERFRMAIKLDPKSVTAYYMLGKALYVQNKLDDATSAYQSAIALDPKDTHSHYGLGLIYRLQGKDDAAIASYRKVIELDLKYANAYQGIGNALMRQGKDDEAIVEFRKAIELDPKIPAYDGLAEAVMKRWWDLANHPDPKVRDTKRAAEQGKLALELVSQSSYAWQHMGWIEYRAGNWKASIEALEKSCKMQKGGKGDPFQWLFLAMAHWQMGHKEEARKWYDQTMEFEKVWPEKLRAFRAEAEELMNIKQKAK